MAEPLLTYHERQAITLLGRVHNMLAGDIVSDGPTRAADMAEMTALVHGLQNWILAQAAARAYPDEFRLMGSSVSRETVPE